MTNRIKKNGHGGATKTPPAEQQSAQGQNAVAPRSGPSGQLAPKSGHPLARLRDEMDALFDRYWSQWPAPMDWEWGVDRFWGVDVEDTDTDVMVRAEAPGFEPKDFDIHISGNLLTIRAEHRQESEQKEEGGGRSWERHYGRFERSIPLPTAVNAEQVEAHYRNGVLELRLPRTEEAQRRQIEVKA